MHISKINEYDIEIPYEPYGAQMECMENMLKCFGNKESGMVESPTGTGKTLSILCATIAWMKKNKEIVEKDRITVYICSRTHKQIAQLIETMKMLPNPPGMMVLGSRKHYCVNQDVRKDKNIKEACKSARDGKTCVYFEERNKIEDHVNSIFTIEEAVSKGKSQKACPYYGLKKRLETKRFIFAPYNYIMHPGIRSVLKINLENSILIIDEGHNIDDVCRETGSLSLGKADLKNLIKYMPSSRLCREEGDAKEENRRDANVIQGIFEKIHTYIESYVTEHEKIWQKRGKYITDAEKEMVILEQNTRKELEKMGFTEEKRTIFNIGVKKINQLEKSDDEFPTEISQKLILLNFIIEIIFRDEKEVRYRISVSDEKLSFYCLQANLIFEDLYKKARSIVLLSGTLSPFAALSFELTGSPSFFKNNIITKHVIEKNQVFPICITGAGNAVFQGTYKNISTDVYLKSVCEEILGIVKTLNKTGGVLIFVPSYKVKTELGNILSKHITTYTEKENNEAFLTQLQSYKKNCKEGNCVLVGVFRGKASEGINFCDAEARAIVAISIPFSSLNAKSIMLKKEYNNRYMRNSGDTWYTQNAYKAVNQAAGRVIRHKKDWGGIFLIDLRYSYANNRTNLSPWIRNDMRFVSSFESIQKEFVEFIKQFHADYIQYNPQAQNGKRLLQGADENAAKIYKQFPI
ncbi:regulator of telomere elongation helicase 1 [Nematocida sp. LUAm3]|nr:regulator of telomere elongation helicase 1 [Nematocida sp. LUAm3]KAI5174025.1 regulator of telomere elongation helicase 1 [Nematocida sp. LUAm2]KAI5177232.1 regulator of telomere elongation helicase 1 [Nematocida sp. LUAm1]